MTSNDTGRIARVMCKGQTELDMACSDHTNQINFGVCAGTLQTT